MDLSDLDHHLIYCSWTHSSQPLKRHLYRFSRFCTVHPCAQHTDTHRPRYVWHLSR